MKWEAILENTLGVLASCFACGIERGGGLAMLARQCPELGIKLYWQNKHILFEEGHRFRPEIQGI
jgi:hypothetical protein